MSRILVVGMGVPGFLDAPRHAGPGLRAAHFASALAAAGHEVLLLAVLSGDEDAVDTAGSPLEVLVAREDDFAKPALARRIDGFAPEAVVGVTVYAAALAARHFPGLPLWADVFGDLMAEAQAKAARNGSDWSLVHFWTLLRAVLEGADRFSAVSRAQGHALLGQLGLAGRLGRRTAHEDLVSVIPCAAETPPAGAGAGDAAAAARTEARAAFGYSEDDFVLLASGGVNTWFDVETFCAGVAAAMQADPRVKLLVTGGGIPGHDEASAAALFDGLAHVGKGRVLRAGWVSRDRLLAAYAAADLALQVERPLVERTLGAENRLVEWMAHGVPCACTALSECGAELAKAGMLRTIRAGDAADLARTILEAAASQLQSAVMAEHARRWVLAEREPRAVAAPLVAWCRSPQVAADRGSTRVLRLGLVSRPETSLEMLEAYVASLSVRELARRGLRWLLRRAWGALAGGASKRSGGASTAPMPAGDAIVPTIQAAAAAAVSSPAKQGPRRRVVAATALATTVAVAAALLLGGGCKPEHRSAKPNILLLSVDTLRADHLGAYGYGAKPSPTPWMDRLASEGVLFEHAYTSAPETAPALATLVTGTYQDRHGILYNRATLAEGNRTLAERLHDGGYATHAFLANWLVDPAHGFGQGFDHVEMMPDLPDTPSSDDRVVSEVGSFLRDAPRDRPWFAWVHLMDPHGPYDSAPAWWSRDFDYSAAPLARDGEFPDSGSNFGLGVIPRYQKLEKARTLSDYVRRYDGELRFTDAQVGALMGMLAETGQAGDTVVVLVADHGESLVEHDELLQHGWFVYQPTVRVPLVVRLPDPPAARAGTRVTAEACSVDVVPTLLELAGVAAAGDDFDGRSLAPELGLRAARPDEAGDLRREGCFTVGPRANHPYALRRRGFELVVTPAGMPSDPRAPKDAVSEDPERVQLFDLAADPGEAVDLAARRPDVAEPMQAAVMRLRSRFRSNGWRW